MDAIVLAGGTATSNDPLYKMANGGLKSLIPIAGKPMVQWVLDALSGAQLVDHVVVMGIPQGNNLHCSKEVHYLDDSGSLIGNIQQGCEFLDKLHPQDSHVITISADIPALTPSIIDHCIREYHRLDLDICYTVLERTILEKRFPNSKRTYIKVKDGEVCGGDLNCIRKKAVTNPTALWNKLIENRKNPLKQAALIGYDTLILLFLGKLTLDDAAARVCRRIGLTGKAIRSSYAEIGMDVDKPFQFEILEKDLLR